MRPFDTVCDLPGLYPCVFCEVSDRTFMDEINRKTISYPPLYGGLDYYENNTRHRDFHSPPILFDHPSTG